MQSLKNINNQCFPALFLNAHQPYFLSYLAHLFVVFLGVVSLMK